MIHISNKDESFIYLLSFNTSLEILPHAIEFHLFCLGTSLEILSQAIGFPLLDYDVKTSLQTKPP